ncbi:MAG: DUF2523 family protein [Pseudomonadota bacterium]
MEALIQFLEQILVWFKELMLWIPRKLAELILDGLAALIEAIPVPGFLQNASGFLGAIDPNVAYFLEGFAFAEGLSIILSAYVLRFLIRRIPLVG